MTAVTDAQIEACGFRMFELHEIAATMTMHDHPSSGGDYIVLGNKRERMAQYGNAVTPPVTRLIMGRLLDVLGGGATFKDLFCGAGGSSIGAEMAGAELRLGLNHWALAIETHATNFPNADHDCADVSALTTSQIRRYPDSDVLLASPECTNHSLAKGALRKKPQSASLFEDGPGGDEEQDRSRATMWDVVRFAEQKLLKGKPYRAMVVENVVDAYRWGAGDDGGLFAAWRMALSNLGYDSEIVWLNSMFAPPTPQSRDRMYVVFWQRGMKRPDLRVEPPSWCPRCEKIVHGQQTWKRPERPHETAQGKPVGARYGVQYVYGCPDCHGVVLPGAFPAATAIDFATPIVKIGDRDRPLAHNTTERIRRGLQRLIDEPFAIRLLQSGTPKPLTLPFVTLTARHDLAMVMPIAAGTFERTPGNRARDAETQPMYTVHGTLNQAIVVPNRMNNVPRVAGQESAPPILTGGTVGLVEVQNHGGVRDVDTDPQLLPFGSITATDGYALVVPYQSEPHRSSEPARTVTTVDRLALVVPPMNNGLVQDANRHAGPTQTASSRAGIVEVPEAA